MTNTKERNNWNVTSKALARVREIRKEIEKEKILFENTPQICPTHGDASNFKKRDGAYTRGFAVFECPQGHEFQIG